MNSFFKKFKSKKKGVSDLNNIIEMEHYLDESPTTDFKKNSLHIVCDDAYLNRLVLKKFLNEFGSSVDEAENGLDLIQKIKTNGEYAVIWLDIKMPKMDGVECTRYLRNSLNYKGIIVGLTGCVDIVTINLCYKEGMNHVLSKPFDKKIVQMYVDKYKDS
jgi:CheY-like chemotaxis protein